MSRAQNISSRVLASGGGGYATESLVIAKQHQFPSVARTRRSSHSPGVAWLSSL